MSHLLPFGGSIGRSFFFALLRSQRHCLSAFVFLRSDRTYFLIFFFCSAHRRHSNRCRTAASWLDRLSRATADIFENINTWHFRRSDLLILFHFDWTARPSAEKKRVRRRFDSFRRRRLARRTTQTKENAPKIERLTEFFIAIDADFCFCFFYFFLRFQRVSLVARRYRVFFCFSFVFQLRKWDSTWFLLAREIIFLEFIIKVVIEVVN